LPTCEIANDIAVGMTARPEKSHDGHTITSDTVWRPKGEQDRHAIGCQCGWTYEGYGERYVGRRPTTSRPRRRAVP